MQVHHEVSNEVCSFDVQSAATDLKKFAYSMTTLCNH